jgi:hypothetical protein
MGVELPDMRKRLGGGAGIAVSLLLIAAAGCSSSSDKAHTTPTVFPTVSVGSSPTTLTAPTTPPSVTTKTTPGETAVTQPGGVTVPPTATTATTDPPPPTTPPTTPRAINFWKFALDYQCSASTAPGPFRCPTSATPGQNPFPNYLGGPKVWSLRESSSLQFNGNYPLLPRFASSFSSGVAAWHDGFGACGGNAPLIGVATIDAPLSACHASIPGNAAFLYPDASHMAVVGWTSPYNGTATIVSAVADLDGSCGDGVDFYVDRGTTQLADIRLVNNNAVTLRTITTPVTIGQTIYFIVDAGPAGFGGHDSSCDATQLQASIAQG